MRSKARVLRSLFKTESRSPSASSGSRLPPRRTAHAELEQLAPDGGSALILLVSHRFWPVECVPRAVRLILCARASLDNEPPSTTTHLPVPSGAAEKRPSAVTKLKSPASGGANPKESRRGQNPAAHLKLSNAPGASPIERTPRGSPAMADDDGWDRPVELRADPEQPAASVTELSCVGHPLRSLRQAR